MPAQAAPQVSDTGLEILSQDHSRFRQTNAGLEVKEEEGVITIKGYVATKGLDKVGDIFTDKALEGMAAQLQQDVKQVDAVFTETDYETIKEAYSGEKGNLGHNNAPGFPFSDSRIVPAFKMVSAEYDGYGVMVTAEMNLNAQLENTAMAVKAALEDGLLDAFSVEFVATQAQKEIRNGEEVRLIHKAVVAGAALTGRPAQPRAKITDVEFREAIGEDIIQEKEGINSTGTSEAGGDNMPEEDQDSTQETEVKESDAEQQEGDSPETKEEVKSLRDAVSELKEDYKSLVEEHKELKTENAELKEELEDQEEFKELTSDIDEIREELKELEPASEPQTADEGVQTKEGSEDTTDRFEMQVKTATGGAEVGSESWRKYVVQNKEGLAYTHGMTTEEVIERATK